MFLAAHLPQFALSFSGKGGAERGSAMLFLTLGFGTF